MTDDELEMHIAAGTDLPTALAAMQEVQEPVQAPRNRWAWDATLVVGLIVGLALIWYFVA